MSKHKRLLSLDTHAVSVTQTPGQSCLLVSRLHLQHATAGQTPLKWKKKEEPAGSGSKKGVHDAMTCMHASQPEGRLHERPASLTLQACAGPSAALFVANFFLCR
mmetsp:Transcript_43334/g.85524  ORF Transcript_43334/g.85524 Transcript_43334/m.85524 type:complete len:105 (-) Transcript_43334:43-357(-)